MKILFKISVLCIGLFSFSSCTKDKPTPPVLSTADVTAITFTTASSGGIITNEGGSPLLSKGVCWNTTGNPTTSDSKTDEGTSTSSFTSSLSALTQSTKYYVRAYAINNIGTSYGNVVTFSTPKAKLYIRGNFGNEFLECNYATQDFNKYYLFQANPLADGFTLFMHNKSNLEISKYIQIEIARINIDTLRTPWENDPVILYPKAYVNLSMVDATRASNLWSQYDSINYSGSQLFGDPVYLKINAITGDTISGLFHGDVKTKTGLLKHVTNGEFKVKFNTIHQ
jgi:hypothetical protein